MSDHDLRPVKLSDKRIVNGSGDINQLAPFKYKWAWEMFLKANNNHWTPNEVQMTKDKADYETRLTPADKHVFENVFAYLTTSDILAMRNIGLAVMEKMTSPELQIYQARQVYEEALHTWTYQHCIENIGLDQAEIYNRYRVVPEIHGKIKFANKMLSSVLSTDIDLTNKDDLHAFMKSYIFFAAIFEGIWFYNGFTPIFALQRVGLMPGSSEQLQYIMRDEIMHFTFGMKVVNTMMEEENYRVPQEEIHKMFKEAEQCERTYINYVLPRPVHGYSAETHMEEFKYLADRRLVNLGYDRLYGVVERPVTWLAEQANVRKDKNGFETRATEYETGGELNFDEDE